MSLPRSAADVLSNHVTLELESIDRMYLNLYIPILQRPAGVAHFWIHHRGHQLASSALMAPMTAEFVSSIEEFAAAEGVDLRKFEKGESKEEVAQEYLVIRDNLDLGRPDRVQLVFQRRVTRRTPGRFRTRVITDGVIPTLYIDYKHTRIKQYHKEGRALRTETTTNDTRDFAIGKRLKNLPALREVGFQANRRLLDVQRISHDCWLGEDAFRGINDPVTAGTQRASDSASGILESSGCCASWSCSGSCPEASPTAIYASTWAVSLAGS